MLTLTSNFSIVYLICVLGLLLAFGFQVQDQVSKFLNGDKTITKTLVDDPDGIQFPMISFCPGFKLDVVSKYKWPVIGWNVIPENYTMSDLNEMYPKTLEEAEKFWSESTFAYDEIVNQFGSWQLKGFSYLHDYIQRDTSYGRCYSLHLPHAVAPDEMLWLSMNFSQLRHNFIPIHLHDKDNTLGFYFNYWMIPVTTVKVEADMQRDFAIKKKRQISLEGDKDQLKTENEYLKCVSNAFRRYFLSQSFPLNATSLGTFCENSSLCYFPYLKSLVDGIDHKLPYCNSIQKWICNRQYLMKVAEIVFNLPDKFGCHKPDATTTFEYRDTLDSTIMLGNDEGRAWFIFETTKVTEEREYVLLDFNAILGTIGGSLGMFIGISCLDVIKWIIEKVRNKMVTSPEEN